MPDIATRTSLERLWTLHGVPRPIREVFLVNYRVRGNEMPATIGLSRSLDQAFHWRDSIQGQQFWEEVHGLLVQLERA